MSADGRYRHYVLGVLTLVYTLNYLDRGLMILLLQPIKEDLQLSDTQLGFVTGIAFALFYATLGVPIARLADRGNRVTLTAVAIALWGMTMSATFAVKTFAHLTGARIAAAVGEAGCMPPTYSLIGDYFSSARDRARAMSVYWLASPLALLISLIAGGWLNERYGWRLTFLILGLPALLVSILVKLTVRETRRAPEPLVAERTAPRVSEVLTLLWSSCACRHLTCAIVLMWMVGLGLAPWYAAFMIRSHGADIAELGLWLGALFGVGGVIGILLGGQVVARRFSNDARAQLRGSALAVASTGPCTALFLFAPAKLSALLGLAPAIIVFNLCLGPVFALLQRLTPDRIRATTLAVVMLLANLIGLGIGPQIVGILSDALMPKLGTDSLRYAMLCLSLASFWSAFHFWRAGRTVAEDLAAGLLSIRA